MRGKRIYLTDPDVVTDALEARLESDSELLVENVADAIGEDDEWMARECEHEAVAYARNCVRLLRALDQIDGLGRL